MELKATYEASAGAAVTATLSVQAEQFSWEDTRQNGVFVRTVVQTGGRLTAVKKRDTFHEKYNLCLRTSESIFGLKQL